jgi:hypothetical protein
MVGSYFPDLFSHWSRYRGKLTSVGFGSNRKIRLPLFAKVFVKLMKERHNVGCYANLICDVTLIEGRIVFGLEYGRE